MLLLGYEVQLGALLLIAFIVVATALFLRFWRERDVVKKNFHAILFCNNFAIVGGLVILLK